MKKATIALLLICTAIFAQQKGTFTDSRDKKKYKTVKIGYQTWMAENLNYNEKGSECYENKPDNCKKYGRLYNQDAAQKTCPKGWGLPSDEDWLKLAEYIGSEPALKLKAKDSWDKHCYTENCNGKDDFGFAALAGGYRETRTQEDYETMGDHGYWWTAESAARMASYYNEIRFGYYSSRDNYAFSLRCLKELTAAEKAAEKKAIEKAKADSIAKVKAKEKAQADSIAKLLKTAGFDPREKKQYKTVKIGEQIWMAENLNYNEEGSKCYDNKPENCKKYGRLYGWLTAMKLPSVCADNNCSNQIRSKHQGICPDGWHIPSSAELSELMTAVGGKSSAGAKLKAKSGWNNGKDEFGFSALPGGYVKSDGGFDAIDKSGLWWSAHEFNNYYTMSNTRDDVYIGNVAKNLLLSIRCIHGEASKEVLPPVPTPAPAKAPAAAPAKAPAAPANNPSKPMYCVSYIAGKAISCMELKGTQDVKKLCDAQNDGMKMMGGQAKLTDAKPNINCGK